MKLFLLIATMLLPQAPAAQSGQVAGAVTGIVTVGGTAQGIPDADIQIAVGNQKWDAVSDANGRFTLSNVPAGRYTLNIQADGYYAAPASANSPVLPLVSVPVTVGPSNPPVSASMMRGSVISGKVLDSSGQPLIAAEVAAFTIPAGRPVADNNLQAFATRTTDDHGEYRLFWLPPGEYFIAAVPRPSFSPAARSGDVVMTSVRPTFFPSVSDVAAASKVAVKSGEEVRGIDVAARTDLAAQQKITSVKVSGQITNMLYPGPTAGALSIAPKGFGGDAVVQISSVLLNGPTVPFEIPNFVPNLPPGAYDLYIRVEDPRGTQGRGGVVSAWGHASLEVLDRDVDNVSLTVHASVEVSGVLQIDGKAAPAGGAMKIALVPTGTATRLPSYTGVTDRAPAPGADGTFSIAAVPDGNFTVTVSGLPLGSYVSDVRQGEISIFGKGLDVGTSKPTPLEVFVKSDAGSIEGVVTPAAASVVAIIPEDRQMMRLAQSANTGADGKFSFKGLRPGAYKVFAIPNRPNAQVTDLRTVTDPRTLSKIEDKGLAVTVKPSAVVTANATAITD